MRRGSRGVLRAGAVELHFQSLQGEEPASDLGAAQGVSGLAEGLYLGDWAVQELIDEGVAHALDGLGLGRGEVHAPEGAGELVAPDLLGPVPELLYEGDDVERADPAHELLQTRPDHGLPRLPRLAPPAAAALDPAPPARSAAHAR